MTGRFPIEHMMGNPAKESVSHVVYAEVNQRPMQQVIDEAVAAAKAKDGENSTAEATLVRVNQFGSVALGSRRKFFQGALD